MIKYIKPIIIGAITLPKISPSLIHPFLNGVRIFELIMPSIRKI